MMQNENWPVPEWRTTDPGEQVWVEFCRNKPLRILAFFFITAFAMMAIGNSAGSYYMIYNVRAPEMLPYFIPPI